MGVQLQLLLFLNNLQTALTKTRTEVCMADETEQEFILYEVNHSSK